MDRQQKINQIANLSGRVSKVHNVNVEQKQLHPEYGVEPCEGVLSATGKLEVLKLVQKSGAGKYFIARWDQRPEELDIDMHGASDDEIRKFKANKDGYSGHHTRRTSDPDKRIFDVLIEIQGAVIFDGTVSFSNNYEMKADTGIFSMVTVGRTVLRAISKKEGS